MKAAVGTVAFRRSGRIVRILLPVEDESSCLRYVGRLKLLEFRRGAILVAA